MHSTKNNKIRQSDIDITMNVFVIRKRVSFTIAARTGSSVDARTGLKKKRITSADVDIVSVKIDWSLRLSLSNLHMNMLIGH
ncbi:hypothetical protein [Thermaerobacillus caldiproteolyticus]|uniref:hypothetical protein n=1 Tax=Thermaerobacillus caldiproteolyticus TaxID=247480 RepID=UPI00188B8A88|nr:hypothetical protein [Anoxybacillus caldiproteolyticus]QPA31361.1 hypothetical protein ISX45_18250 [Anoxybacillus caldiproteolyticus]